MTTIAERIPETERAVETAAPGVRLKLSRPTTTAVVVHVAGDVDASTAPRLHELLAPRLSSVAETVVVDLSEVGFLGVAGLELLSHAQHRAAARGVAFRVVDGPVCVDRALRAAGWTDAVAPHPTVASALSGDTGWELTPPVLPLD
ncbi:STAS domain-containing protein [Saccharopolyspora cebuensis]|uniref:STAS domain-containing protein n=1 Tax=Saccharopolyspora cebuensis TaxID=418759 RepID=UPI0031EA13CB